ncbi:G-protein coupled receptor 54-like [Anneissia japonica]|uniref:G-protein coupled receptor 54-like n=1 Tax=Anneissia japonica TaxID=1529436 RepID=UPI001425783C|nr:G-protein coupled receptor 54-like [Anneissia japonica]
MDDEYYSNMSSSSSVDDEEFIREFNEFLQLMSIVPPVVYIFIIVIGIIGNVIVFYIIFKHQEMRTATNYFLANLAMTDIALLLSCALPTTFIYRGWTIGPTVCRIINYMMLVSVQATCLTLAIMSIDRYRLVVLAIRSRNTRSKTMVIIIGIITWIVSFTIHIPTAVYMTINSDGVCIPAYPSEFQKKVYIALSSCTTYFLPLASILICYLQILIQVWRKTSRGTESAQAHRRYVRRRRRVTRMVFTIVILFAVCWAPAQAMFLIDTFHPHVNGVSSLKEYKIKSVLRFLTFCLAYANSAMNPIVYGFAVRCFRKYFVKMFFIKVPIKKNQSCVTTMQARNGISTKFSRYSSEDML